jgi:hypothetical protein
MFFYTNKLYNLQRSLMWNVTSKRSQLNNETYSVAISFRYIDISPGQGNCFKFLMTFLY